MHPAGGYLRQIEEKYPLHRAAFAYRPEKTRGARHVEVIASYVSNLEQKGMEPAELMTVA